MLKQLLAIFSALFLSLAATKLCFAHHDEITVTAQCIKQVIVVGSDTAVGDHFGWSVAMDGNNALVGVTRDEDNGSSSGSAYIFTKVSTATVEQVTKLLASDGDVTDQFGDSVALDGTNALIGAIGDGDKGYYSGSAYIFSEISAGNWVQVDKLLASDGAPDDRFGDAVAIDGTTALIGAAYEGDAGNSRGSVYIFSEQSPGNWIQVAKIIASDAAAADKFGDSLALEGTNALIGSLYDDDLGFNSGSAFIFSEVSAGNWDEVAKLVPSDGAAELVFGVSAAMDGTNALIGAYGDDAFRGSAYIFSEVSAGTWVEVAKLVASDGISGDWFAISLSISGCTVVVGSYYDDDVQVNSGSVYVFSEISAGNWVEVDKFTASNAGFGFLFGVSVAISGANVIVGAFRTDDESGSAYMHFLDDPDNCPGNACEHGSTCVDGFDEYCCVCPPAYGGEFCTDCLCENGGVCQDDILGIGYCDCSDINYSGDTCSKFCNNGVGEAYPDTGCNCTLSGATGGSCNKDIDDCLSSPCVNGGTCSDYGADLFPNHNNEFNCSCDGTGYHGELCQTSDCASSPCLNAGTCELLPGPDVSLYAACNCSHSGYEGDWCQTEIDECTSSPCLNDGICTDLLGDFTCDCAGTGYEGVTCAMDVDDCLSSPCQNDGACQDKGANKFKCTCDEFWEGDVCTEDVDDCILKGYYCENGAACTDDSINMGDVMCDCSTSTGGFTGKYCDVPIEDACVTFNPCFNGGKCSVGDITKELSCDCADTGYEGDVCDVQVYVSECVSGPCLNEGQCYDPSDQEDDWYCECIDDYFGDLCDLQACDSMPCQNGGTCTNDDDAYTCACPENYSGIQCQENEDEQVGVGSSSSSSSSSTESQANVPKDDDTAENDGGMLIIIIIIVVVVVVVGAVGGFFYKKQQSTKSFTMPT